MTDPVPPSSNVQNSADFVLSPGESSVYGDVIQASVLAPYLKVQLMCSSTRFVFKVPNLLLGFIPVGTREDSCPIRNIANVSSSTSFLLKRFIVGVVLAIFGLYYVSGVFFAGLLILLLAAGLLVTSFPTVLLVVDLAGGAYGITVSPLDRQKLQRFTMELQSRVFVDKSQVQHQEAQTVRNQQVLLQQLAIQQQMGIQQQMLSFQQQHMAQQRADAQTQQAAAPQAGNAQNDEPQTSPEQPGQPSQEN